MAAPPRSMAVAISVARADRARMHQLGYKQELKRGLSVVSNFEFSFSLISVLTGVTSTNNTGLRYGVPASMTLGWLVVASFNGCVALSMAEICSAYPTSVDFSLAQLLQVIILLGTGGAQGGGYRASKYVVLAIYGFILVLHGLINSLPIHWLSWFGKFGAFWNAAGILIF